MSPRKSAVHEDMVFDVFETEFGWVALVGSATGIIRTSLPEATPELAQEFVLPEIGTAVHSPERLGEQRALIVAYCAGEPVDLGEIPIDTRAATPFFRKAWEACRSIPAGETRTYAWLAEQAGNIKASRGAGQAMARNKIPLLVPCHRVIGSSGKLHGFGGGVGLPLKSRLLAMEAAR